MERAIGPLVLNTVAAGTDDAAYAVWPFTEPARVSALRIVPQIAVTANATNYATLSVEIDGTEIATEATTVADLGDLVAGTDIAAALTGSGTSLEVAQNAVIAFKKTASGTGVAVGNMALMVLCQTDRLD